MQQVGYYYIVYYRGTSDVFDNTYTPTGNQSSCYRWRQQLLLEIKNGSPCTVTWFQDKNGYRHLGVRDGKVTYLKWSNTSNKIAATCNKIWFLRMLIEMFTHTLQITRQHVSTFLLKHALKSDFVASCSDFVARITPVLSSSTMKSLYSCISV
jgi:hypothetical protein